MISSCAVGLPCWSVRMQCQFCNRAFASKYTLRRHIAHFHREMKFEETEENIKDDTFSSAIDSDDTKTDISTNSESSDVDENIDEENKESDEQSEKDDELEEKEDSFWTLLIRETVKEIYNERKARGLPGHSPELTEVSQLFDGKNLSALIDRLRNRYSEICDITSAAEADSLMELIHKKQLKIQDELPGESIEEEGEEMAWNRYKFIIRKRIIENSEEFMPLVGESDSDNENEESENYE